MHADRMPNVCRTHDGAHVTPMCEEPGKKEKMQFFW
jgi:hypothetical protein